MFEVLIAQFVTLAGVAAFIAAIVNVAKTFGLPDGKAPEVSASLSLVAFIALVALRVFRPDVDIQGLDKAAADAAVAVLYVLGFLVQMGLPARVHAFVKGVPVIGKSYSSEANG